MRELEQANPGAAAEDESATQTEHRSSISRQEFITQIEPFKTSKPDFHKQLLQVFDNDKSLSELNLGYNQIGDEGAQALATALEQNTSLTELYLDDNQIGDAGALAAIDNALVANNNTKELKSTQVEGQEAEKTGGSATEASGVFHVARLKCNKAESTQGL